MTPPRRFVSTRGGARYTFKEAVLAGWADDGGMILPEQIPVVTRDMLATWRGLSYPELVVELLTLFLGDEAFAELPALVKRSFDTFSSDKVVDLRPLTGTTSEPQYDWLRLHVAELFHGPSLAFKDLGMQVLANLLQHYLEEDKASMTFLVGTSGDTGPSALAAVRGKPRMSVVVLYPLNRVSPTQEAQMLAAHGDGCVEGRPNCHVIAVDGTSDDLDEPIAALFADAEFRATHRLGSLNSVNIVRLIMQVFHYFYTYLLLTRRASCWEDGSPLERVSFCVPTGAAGHVTAGIVAALMGLPIDRLVMATNENDILDVMMRTGVLQKKPAVLPTNSPAMDIQAPYNIERILRLLWPTQPPDGAAIRAFMDRLYEGEAVPVPAGVMERLRSLGVVSTAIAQGHKRQAVLGTMKQVFERDGYLVDPHTAVGVAAALELACSGSQEETEVGRPRVVVCMGCAHPAKFASTVGQALGVSTAEAERGIVERSHPEVVQTLRLVETLRAGARAGKPPCPMFAADDRHEWTEQLAKYIAGMTHGDRD